MNFGLKKVMAPEGDGVGGGGSGSGGSPGGGGVNDIDVQSLVQGIENQPAHEVPMHDPKPQTQSQQAAKEYAFEVGGKQIKIQESDPKFQQWLKQGYSYAQDMNKFKSERQSFETQQREHAQKLELINKYKEVDEFAAKNPDWWKHVESTFQNRAAHQMQLDPANPVTQQLLALQESVNKANQFIENQNKEKEEARKVQEDTQLESEIKSIREQYSNLDFSTPDANGDDLVLQVMKFASENGIRSFKPAFLAYNHERLTQLAIDKAKEDLSKTALQNKQNGIIGQTNTPTKVAPTLNTKNMTYEQIHQAVLAEHGVQ